VKVSFLTRDRERDREREFFFGLTLHHDHFGICQEYTWNGTLTITRQERFFPFENSLYPIGLLARIYGK
jgi:hypothetical protein